MDEDYKQVLERALALGRERHPDTPAEHHGAFANSVAYCITGYSGGFGGRSMREHLARRTAHARSVVGSCDFDTAVEVVEGICYGPLTLEHAQILENEDCFDDAPGEVEAARLLLATEQG